MLVFTGVMIGVVLVVMVGQTARTMQGTGWLPITSLDIDLPYWLGLWFGVFPTVETLRAQVVAALFVIGSYFVAQEVRVKRPRRKAKAAPAARGTPARTRWRRSTSRATVKTRARPIRRRRVDTPKGRPPAIAAVASIDPRDSNGMPVSPLPMLQPCASVPPTPIARPPAAARAARRASGRRTRRGPVTAPPSTTPIASQSTYGSAPPEASVCRVPSAAPTKPSP